MANNTLKALSSLADQVPGLNQRALKQVQAARDIGLQRQIGAAPKTLQAGQSAQQLATQRAMQAGQDIVAQRQQASGRAEQIRQATLQERQRQGQAGLQQQQLAQQQRLEEQRLQQLQQLRQEELQSRKQTLDSELEAAARLQELGIDQDNRLQIATLQQREDLARLGQDVKTKLLDNRLRFKKDERGRAFSNERQLADYVASSAASKQEFNQKMSQLENMHKQKTLILQQTQAQLERALERGFLKEQGDLDFESKKRITQLAAQTKEDLRKEAASAANRQAMYQAGGTVLGAGLGGPEGAAIGGALGSLAGGL